MVSGGSCDRSSSSVADDEYIVAVVDLEGPRIIFPVAELSLTEVLKESGTKVLWPGYDVVAVSVKLPG